MGPPTRTGASTVVTGSMHVRLPPHLTHPHSGCASREGEGTRVSRPNYLWRSHPTELTFITYSVGR